MDKKDKGPSFISRAYLILYNIALCVGWGYVLFGAARYCWQHRPVLGSHVPGLYDSIKTGLCIFQTAAFLEVSEHNIYVSKYMNTTCSGGPLCYR